MNGESIKPSNLTKPLESHWLPNLANMPGPHVKASPGESLVDGNCNASTVLRADPLVQEPGLANESPRDPTPSTTWSRVEILALLSARLEVVATIACVATSAKLKSDLDPAGNRLQMSAEVEAWPALPEAIKAGILPMARAAK